MSSGKMFHIFGAAVSKALSSSVFFDHARPIHSRGHVAKSAAATKS